MADGNGGAGGLAKRDYYEALEDFEQLTLFATLDTDTPDDAMWNCSYAAARRIRSTINEYGQLFTMIHDADMRGVAMWRAQSPVERDLKMPDKAKMVCWLMQRLDEKEERINGLLNYNNEQVELRRDLEDKLNGRVRLADLAVEMTGAAHRAVAEMKGAIRKLEIELDERDKRIAQLEKRIIDTPRRTPGTIEICARPSCATSHFLTGCYKSGGVRAIGCPFAEIPAAP